MTTQFDDIRPYNDQEVKPALERLLNDKECISVITRLRFSHWPKWSQPLLSRVVKFFLKRQLNSVDSVDKVQLEMESYLGEMINETITELSHSGLEKLDSSKTYLFISNHRDITCDPALVNWLLYQNGFQTLRIAIGDNLLTKPFVEDLMRLNKSFIVNRSATSPREKFKAAKHLSAYINHSINKENSNVWIAQREGRAKDGNDKTNSAIMSMLALCKPKPQRLGEFIEQLNIVPVSISYEWDACDRLKARELYLQATEGEYQKAEHEDAASIARGITGNKGRVHVAFGTPLTGDFVDSEALARALDEQIILQYQLHPSNYSAYKAQGHSLAEGEVADEAAWRAHIDTIEPEYRDYVVAMYANSVHAQKNHAP